MKRKIIQVGNSTQLISLPLKWAKSMNLKKGDEVTIDEKQDSIIVSASERKYLETIELDISNFCYETIQTVISGLYRKGYDEITFNFKNQETTHEDSKKEIKVNIAIRDTINNLIGFEVITEKRDSCTVKDLAGDSDKEVKQIIRRIFLLILEASGEFSEAIKTNNKEKYESIIKSKDNIVRFINYCLRLLNKHGYKEEPLASHSLYAIISTLETIIRKIKESATLAITFGHIATKYTIKACKNIDKNLHTFYEIFYKYNPRKFKEIGIRRHKSRETIVKHVNELKESDILILHTYGQISDTILSLINETIGFTLSHEKENRE